jgi:hypothetical protein
MDHNENEFIPRPIPRNRCVLNEIILQKVLDRINVYGKNENKKEGGRFCYPNSSQRKYLR